DGPRDDSHLLKSRFMPYFSTTEQFSSFPLASFAPEHCPRSTKLFFGSLSTTLGISAGSTTTAPCCLSTAIASVMTLAWSAFNPPRPSASSGRPELVEGRPAEDSARPELAEGRASSTPGGVRRS